MGTLLVALVGIKILVAIICHRFRKCLARLALSFAMDASRVPGLAT